MLYPGVNILLGGDTQALMRYGFDVSSDGGHVFVFCVDKGKEGILAKFPVGKLVETVDFDAVLKAVDEAREGDAVLVDNLGLLAPTDDDLYKLLDFLNSGGHRSRVYVVVTLAAAFPGPEFLHEFNVLTKRPRRPT